MYLVLGSQVLISLEAPKMCQIQRIQNFALKLTESLENLLGSVGPWHELIHKRFDLVIAKLADGGPTGARLSHFFLSKLAVEKLLLYHE